MDKVRASNNESTPLSLSLSSLDVPFQQHAWVFFQSSKSTSSLSWPPSPWIIYDSIEKGSIVATVRNNENHTCCFIWCAVVHSLKRRFVLHSPSSLNDKDANVYSCAWKYGHSLYFKQSAAFKVTQAAEMIEELRVLFVASPYLQAT